MQRLNSGSGDQPIPNSTQLAPKDPGFYLPTPSLSPGQALAPPATSRSWPTLPELVNALKRRIVLATFLGLLVGIASAAAVWLALPNGKHDVKALLRISPNMTSNGESVLSGEAQFDAFKQTQQKLIRTRSLLERVRSTPAVAKLPDIRNADDPVRYIEENIKTSWPSPELLEITMKGDDPKQLETILNTLVAEFIKETNGSDNKSQTQERNKLESMLSNIDAEQDKLSNERSKIARTPNGGTNAETNAIHLKSATDRLQLIYGQIAQIKADMPQLEKDLDIAKARLESIETSPVTQTQIKDALRLMPKFSDLVTQVDRAGDRLEAAQKRFINPQHPAITEGRRALKAAEDTLRNATEQAEGEIREQIKTAVRREVTQEFQRAKDDLDRKKLLLKTYTEDEQQRLNEITELNQLAAKIDNLNADIKSRRELRDSVQQKLANNNMRINSDPRVKVAEEASIYLNQNLKQKVLLAIAAMIAGASALMLAVAFLEWRSRRVDSVDQVISELGLRVIGTIPAFPTKQALKSGDAASSQNWRFVLNESVNSARTMLLHTAKTQNMQVLMVTSAMQGEGKTSLASQLATSMATAGLRTLILDCDLRNPSMHKLFDAPLTPGCSEVLCQEVDVADAVQPTTVPNLWLIPAGQCSNRVISALAQGHPLETLFNRLRGQFDFVVVDSCPVLPVADTLLVGQHVDGVLISILQDVSQLPKVQQVSDRLTELNIPLLGAVVNGIKPDIHAYGYNYVKQLPI